MVLSQRLRVYQIHAEQPDYSSISMKDVYICLLQCWAFPHSTQKPITRTNNILTETLWSNMSSNSKHVLITGGTGYVATHIIDQLIKASGHSLVIDLMYIDHANLGRRIYNHSYNSGCKKDSVLIRPFPSLQECSQVRLSPWFHYFEAFDEVFKSAKQPFDYILHTASPLPQGGDLQKDVIDVGPKGVLSLFTGAKKYGGKGIKRIVLTR